MGFRALAGPTLLVLAFIASATAYIGGRQGSWFALIAGVGISATLLMVGHLVSGRQSLVGSHLSPWSSTGHVRDGGAWGSLAGLLLLIALGSVRSPELGSLSIAAWAFSIPLFYCALRACAVPVGPQRRWREQLETIPRERETWAVVTVLFVAAILRLWQLEQYPSGIHGDEAEFALIAQRVLEGNGPNPFGTAFLGDPALFVYLEAPFIAVAGVSIAAIRLLAALTGVAVLPVFYLLGREMFGTRPAFLSLLLLSGSALLVNFSRLALNVPQVLLFSTLAFLLLLRGQRGQGHHQWFGAGAAAGLAVYFHFAGRILPIAMAAYVAYLFVRYRSQWRDWATGSLIGLLGGVWALAPMAVRLVDRPSEFTEHIGGRLILTPENWQRVANVHGSDSVAGVLLGQLGTNVLAFIKGGDASSFYTFTGFPLVSPVLGPLLVLSVVFLLAKVSDHRYALLSIWLWSFFLVGGLLTIDSPQAHRLVYSVPPLLLGVALLLEATIRSWSGVVGSRHTAVLFSCAVAVCLLAGVVDQFNYFGVGYQAKPWESTTSQARFIQTLGGDYRAYVAGIPSIYASHGVTRFLAQDTDKSEFHNPAVTLPIPAPSNKGAAVILHPHTALYLPMLQSLYPEAEIRPVTGRNGRTVFDAFLVSAADVREGQALRARYPTQERSERNAIGLGGGDSNYPAGVTWEGGIFAQKHGQYGIQLSGIRGEIFVDGASLGQGNAKGLSYGWHSIRVAGVLESKETRASIRWRPPEEEWALVPDHYLHQRQELGVLSGTLTKPTGETQSRVDGAVGFRNLSDLWSLSSPAEVTWDGTLKVATPGSYSLGIRANGPAELIIDGTRVVSHDATGTEGISRKEMPLAPGAHAVTVRYKWQRDPGVIELLWAPPGEKEHVVPHRAFGKSR